MCSVCNHGELTISIEDLNVYVTSMYAFHRHLGGVKFCRL